MVGPEKDAFFFFEMHPETPEGYNQKPIRCLVELIHTLSLPRFSHVPARRHTHTHTNTHTGHTGHLKNAVDFL